MFADKKKAATFAPAKQKQRFLEIQNSEMAARLCGVLRAAEKNCCKKNLEKDLEVSKMLLTFAVLFAPKFQERSFENGSLTYWYI